MIFMKARKNYKTRILKRQFYQEKEKEESKQYSIEVIMLQQLKLIGHDAINVEIQ